MATMKSFSRPTTTAELVCRLRESNFNPVSEPKIESENDPGEQKPASKRYEVLRMKQEAAALRALSRSMIHTFYTNPNNAYAAEAASLSLFADPESYQILFQTFINLVATGSGDCGVPDIKLLTSFNAILHYTQAKHIDKRLPLGHAILSLTKRLTTAGFTGDDSIRYQLLRTLSAILDAMNEIKFEGISDAKVVQPLLDLLDDAGKHRELRLSQAAQYAYQALRGIPSDPALVKDSGKSNRHDAVFILARQNDMPKEILKEIGVLLNHAEPNVRSAAVEVLSQRKSAFPKTILQEISTLLNIHERRHDAMRVLTSHYNLPGDILQVLVDLLIHSESDVRSAAADILSHQRPSFPKTILHRIVSCLDDLERRPGGLRALECQLSLPEQVVQKILRHYHDSYWFAKRDILPRQPSIEPLPEMARMPYDDYLSSETVTAASEILINQKVDLSEEILAEFMRLLKNGSRNAATIAMKKIQHTAVGILRESQQSTLAQNVLQKLVALLKYPCDHNFCAVLEDVEAILVRQPDLPDTVLQDLAAELNDPRLRVWWTVARTLGNLKQSAMSDATFASLLGQMDRQSFNNLYEFWLYESLSGHLTWLTDGEIAVINLPGGEKSVPLNQVKDAIREARANLGVPFRDFNEVL
ncbi:hypothetical protein K449DRAFT_460676 [Hypoxylon sp. EC38]|nr:hypothetical protein K449DRAFT_460676 [Hypoxylon sp. EC38]